MGERYEPVAPIAHGGMAQLSLCRMRGAHGFEKYAAVKRILPQWAGDAEFVEMFLDEARLGATLDHPNVVHVYDFGQDEEGLFLAMEYIHGPSLLSLLRRLRAEDAMLPLRHAVTIGIGIAAGLHHAHERKNFAGEPLGIIHRDVSPTNVLVTYEGVVKVVDFGIAKAVNNEHATKGNARKGKVAYMSPEQCKAAPLDARSDIFALGVLLHELCTMRRCFGGADELAIMNAIVNHDVEPPSTFRPEIPPELDAIVVKALARDPDERWATARAVEDALENLDGLKPSRAALGDFLTDLIGRPPYPWEGLTDPPEGEDALTVRTGDGDEPVASAEAGETRAKPADVERLEAPTVAHSLPQRGGRWRGVAVVAVLLGAGAIAASQLRAGDGPPAESKPEPAAVGQPAGGDDRSPSAGHDPVEREPVGQARPADAGTHAGGVVAKTSAAPVGDPSAGGDDAAIADGSASGGADGSASASAGADGEGEPKVDAEDAPSADADEPSPDEGGDEPIPKTTAPKKKKAKKKKKKPEPEPTEPAPPAFDPDGLSRRPG